MPRPPGAKNTDPAVYRAAVLEVLGGALVEEVAERDGINDRRLYQLVRKARRDHKAALEGALEEVEYWRAVRDLVERERAARLSRGSDPGIEDVPRRQNGRRT